MTNWDFISYNMGMADYRRGKSIDDNPFDIEKETFWHDSWQEGWIKASNQRGTR